MFNLKTVAEELGFKFHAFNKMLRDRGILDSQNLARQHYIQAGLFLIKESKRGNRFVYSTLVTQHGLNVLKENFPK